MSSRSTAECVVSGALACVLHVSRAAGIAPLQLMRVRTGWRARLSLPASVYGEVLSVTLCVLALAALVTDLCIEPERSLKIETRGRRLVYYVDLAIMVLVVQTASFTGSMRMKNMIVYLNQIHKIRSELSSYSYIPSDDKKFCLFFLFSTIGGIFTIIIDFVVLMIKVVSNNGRVLISTMYVFYNILYMTRLILQVQFSLITMTALSPLRQINGCLKDLLEKITTRANTKKILSSRNKMKLNNFIVPNKYEDINHVIDTMGSNVVAEKDPINVPREIHEDVRHLAGLHGCVCNVIRLVDKSHGLILLTLLLSYLLYLVITLYFLINSFLIHTESFPYNSVIQLLWGTFHINSLILVVEPCHQTQDEMQTTREIVREMTQKVVSPYDPLAVELDLFYKHLTLNQATYSPLKMLTVNRALVITMLSAITTYLVVVIQL